MRKLLIVGIALSFLVAVFSPGLAQETLKIGAPQPMTGPDAPFGDKFKKAYGLAVEEINAKGGVNGKKIEVILEDHQAKNSLAATVAEKLITQTKVLVLTGGRASGQAVEIASVAKRLKTPYVVDHPSANIITSKGFEWIFRNNPTGSIYRRRSTSSSARFPVPCRNRLRSSTTTRCSGRPFPTRP
jgi:branched-chain amino acid transport system substrate-binding protein